MALIANAISSSSACFSMSSAVICARSGQLFRHRVEAHAHAGGSGVQQINRFIRKLTSVR
jgi:organic hydroperoxide reductase OsmC/OhrA